MGSSRNSANNHDTFSLNLQWAMNNQVNTAPPAFVQLEWSTTYPTDELRRQRYVTGIIEYGNYAHHAARTIVAGGGYPAACIYFVTVNTLHQSPESTMSIEPAEIGDFVSSGEDMNNITVYHQRWQTHRDCFILILNVKTNVTDSTISTSPATTTMSVPYPPTTSAAVSTSAVSIGLSTSNSSPSILLGTGHSSNCRPSELADITERRRSFEVSLVFRFFYVLKTITPVMGQSLRDVNIQLLPG
ncbi:hypothetical protein BJ742DRAFT_913285 [Cladochytrium replicatum]|nr:hypothetical protein BJ742DRAFT_913285 [Cladochytrium replicatum]